jgi:hypothetical protein
MGIERDQTARTLTWLEFYGLQREAGVLNAFQVQEFLNGGSDILNGSLSEMSTTAGSDDAERVAQAETAGEVITAVGALVVTVAGETVIGAVIGAVIAAIGVAISFLAKYFNIECDKYQCTGYDQKSETEKKFYRANQRSLVGVYIPDSWEYYAKSDCACNYNSSGNGPGQCSFVRYMHDGLIVDGIEYGVLSQGGKTRIGRIRGANAIAGGGNAGCTGYWRNKADSKPLDAAGKDLAQGQYTTVNDAYKSDKNSYYYRAWKVNRILDWMQEHVLCRSMKCMQDVLLHTSESADENAHFQKRRRGSRWYASIVWMMKDLWEYGQKIGWDKVEQFMRDEQVSPEALDTLKKMRRGDTFDQKDTPWEWWPLTSKLTFWQIRGILMRMKPLFSYEPPPPTMPEGRAARERSIALKPLMLPIRTSIVYGRDMKPVPAKIGSRGPGTGTIVLGVGAAAVGAYAIYRVMSRR